MLLTNDLLEKLYARIATVKGKLSGKMPDPLPAITTNDGLLEAIVREANDTVVEAARYKGHAHDNVENAYSFNIPQKLYEWNGVKTIGGKTIVWNQIANSSMYRPDGYASVNGVVTYTDNGFTVIGTSSATSYLWLIKPSLVNGHKYAVKGTPIQTGVKLYKYVGGSYSEVAENFIYDANGTAYIAIRCSSSGLSVNLNWQPQIFDMTVMFGAGNEPATFEEFETMFPADYYEQSANTLKNAGVTKVVNADSADQVVEEYAIPAEMQALDGYGLSCPTAYNYIDFENKKFVQAVGSRAYAAGDESDADVVTDGTTTNYELTTQVVTDISEYLTGDVITEPQAGGSITFENQHGNNYRIPVPVLVDYVGK